MNTIASTHQQHLGSAMSLDDERSCASRAEEGVLSQVSRILRDLACDVAARWRRAAARREFNRLDANALRDLGVSRSEFDSYWAESHGMAEPTRVRVMLHRRGVSVELA